MFDTTPTLDCAGRALKLDRPRIAGILNLTSDSFSGDGLRADVAAAVAQGVAMVEQGADLLDVGAESTRPGAGEISVADEIARVVPVIEALAKRVEVPISIDTSKPEVMRAAVAAGAGFINDVRALRADGALDTAAELKVPVCLMHMQGEPRTMQDAPHYDDVVGEVKNFLAGRIFACEMSGIDKKRIVVDPGFGFGKTLEHNLALLRGLDQLAALGVPLLAGLSRKGMIGALTGRDVEHRAAGSAAAALIAVQKGAMIVRVHDVAATRDALAVWHGVASGAAPAKKAQKPFGSQRFGDDD
ncbi:MAG: dihydropteroate synthase [Proteobacteria bacterium]|uniref:dihydropteroate synthase n=1 Tax=Rudaea sp. TaxID=2136325 RepID=UPI00321F9071|nr:dihydropteroate synthase [Pseudomonadota bacterium]